MWTRRTAPTLKHGPRPAGQWFRSLTELRYAATPKRLRALLGRQSQNPAQERVGGVRVPKQALAPTAWHAGSLRVLAAQKVPALGIAWVRDRGSGRQSGRRLTAGLVYKGLTIKSKSTGVLELSFSVQRDSLDDILPGHGW